MNENIIYADSYDFDDRIENGNVLVFFYDHSDARSRAFESIIEELADKYGENVCFVAVDTEQSPDLALRYSVEVLPSVTVFSGGEIIEQVEGSNSPEIYEDIIDSITE